MNDERMNASIRRASLTLSLMLVVLAIATGYWQVARGSWLSAREDNPRLVLAEQQIPRGAILDRAGQPLAVSQGTPDGYVRYYPVRAAAPVVGYYSLRYGLGGIEAAFDSELRGVSGQTSLDVFADRLLHRVPVGRPVRLTLDAQVQQAADKALGDRAGAVVVLSVPEGQVIALASHPTFDPATLDDDWERLRADPLSPLLNRATQGSYQPGAAFQTVVLAEALSRGLTYLTSTVPISAPVQLGDTVLTCAATPAASTLAAAFAAGCPAPFDALSDDLDARTFPDMLHRWQLDVAPESFELPVSSPSFTPTVWTTTQGARDLVMGQSALTVSPLQVATVIGTIANDGVRIGDPHLTFTSVSIPPTPLLSPEPARAIKSAFSAQDDMAGQVALAVSGYSRLAWFLGFAPAQSPHWAIVVLLENGDAATCRQVAASVRNELKQ